VSLIENSISGTIRSVAPSDLRVDSLYYNCRLVQLDELTRTQSLSALIQWSLFSLCPIKTLCAIFVFPIRVTCSTHLTLLVLIILIIVEESRDYAAHHYAVFSNLPFSSVSQVYIFFSALLSVPLVRGGWFTDYETTRCHNGEDHKRHEDDRQPSGILRRVVS
jgi:hypothetical protein